MSQLSYRYITVESHGALSLQQQVPHPSFLCLNLFRAGFFAEKADCVSAFHTHYHLGASQYNHHSLLLVETLQQLLTQMGIKCLAEGHLDGSCWIQSITHSFSTIRLSQPVSLLTLKPSSSELVSSNFHSRLQDVNFPNYCSNQTILAVNHHFSVTPVLTEMLKRSMNLQNHASNGHFLTYLFWPHFSHSCRLCCILSFSDVRFTSWWAENVDMGWSCKTLDYI